MDPPSPLYVRLYNTVYLSWGELCWIPFRIAELNLRAIRCGNIYRKLFCECTFGSSCQYAFHVRSCIRTTNRMLNKRSHHRDSYSYSCLLQTSPSNRLADHCKRYVYHSQLYSLRIPARYPDKTISAICEVYRIKMWVPTASVLDVSLWSKKNYFPLTWEIGSHVFQVDVGPVA